ncbi:GerMN domain-containing protein [Schaedlerella arabinosiphila]|jgi:Sporulation and spore germination.|uniref:GerMN domain-containing protein n=1 Tax=Schaedlerella arabinosiphila TaxID=2044587 RepID=A0A9X5CGA6_9FIRM|nr:GerMN domain-containing protein [Schaedlerella arabinosiphila]MCI9211441.1 GerMN domain-containing protein [Ruminococcus sp.]KAI4444771.1 hypothetical protein C824_000058 [Schaedlerella arabinosiphila]MCI9603627.1 GerMN domain-containing protein [Ruminococcus sp.]MCI9633257.1 GerMN domain-containing protein [Ruminococcus sp.]NDO71631.1 GerMN domain-containing protein [Schaedlerella arabinosiphila]
MKKMKKITAVWILMAMLAGISGCSKEETPPPAEAEGTTTVTTEAEQKEEPGQVTTGTGSQENVAAQSDTEGQAGESNAVSFSLYSSNDDATGLVQETVEVAALTPENVLAVLIERGGLQGDIRILGFEQAEDNGTRVLNIDFSQEFGTYVGSMGTAGEWTIMGSVCNTFLNAYGCEKVKITVEGGVLTTGHKEYKGYNGYFE